jgi:hypothetical protein
MQGASMSSKWEKVNHLTDGERVHFCVPPSREGILLKRVVCHTRALLISLSER